MALQKGQQDGKHDGEQMILGQQDGEHMILGQEDGQQVWLHGGNLGGGDGQYREEDD